MAVALGSLALASAVAAAAGPLAVGPRGDVAVLSGEPRPLVGALADPSGLFGPFARLRGGKVDATQVVVGPTGEAVAVWEAPSGVMAAVAAPGGSFGSPVVLGKGERPRLAIGPDGGAVVAWNAAREHVTVVSRAPGRDFGKPEPLSATAGRVDGLGVDGAGNAVLLTVTRAADASTGAAVQVTERPSGGKFGAPAAVRAGPDVTDGGAALAVASGGRVLAVWQSDKGIAAAQRPAHGTFDAPTAVTDGACPDTLVDRSAGVADDGYAIVAWIESGTGDFGDESGDGCVNGAEYAETLPDGSFSREVALDRPAAPAQFARVAVDGAGNAAIGTGDERFRATVRYRPTGGQLGPPLDLAGPRRGGVPEVALDPAGHGVALWTENDGEQVRLRLQGFAQTPDSAARTIRTVPAYKHGRRAACFPRGSITLLRSPEARVFKKGPHRLTKYACDLRRGVPIALDYGFDDFPVTTLRPPRMALAGSLAAVVESSAVCGACDAGYDVVDVYDLRTQAEANGYAPMGAPDFGYLDLSLEDLSRLVVNREASVAWTSCYALRCPHGKGAVWAFPAGTRKPQEIDSGRGIVPGSIRLRGRRLSWVHRGEHRSTMLVPAGG